MIFLILLLYAAYTDYTRREIPNSIIIGIYALSLYELSLVLIPTTVTAVLYGYIKSEKSVPLAFVFYIGYIIKAVIFLKGG